MWWNKKEEKQYLTTIHGQWRTSLSNPCAESATVYTYYLCSDNKFEISFGRGVIHGQLPQELWGKSTGMILTYLIFSFTPEAIPDEDDKIEWQYVTQVEELLDYPLTYAHKRPILTKCKVCDGSGYVETEK